MMNYGYEAIHPIQETGMGYGGHFLGFLLMIVFWVLVIGGIVYFFSSRSKHHADHVHNHMAPGVSPVVTDGTAEAIVIAKRRLANGEITPDEYQKIMDVLNS